MFNLINHCLDHAAALLTLCAALAGGTGVLLLGDPVPAVHADSGSVCLLTHVDNRP